MNFMLVSGKVLLEGAIITATDSMRSVLLDTGLIAHLQPYSVAPWNYPDSIFLPPKPDSQIVDWVLVELREKDGVPPFGLPFDRQVALVKEDGSLVGLDGFSPLMFCNPLFKSVFVPNGTWDFSIVIYHRNHLPIMGLPVAQNNFLQQVPGGYSVYYDFSDTLNLYHDPTISTNPPAAFLSPQNLAAMWMGNAIPDSMVNAADSAAVDLANPMFSVYRIEDVNLDGDVDGNDVSDATGNLGKISHVPH